jgi:hypothetical protein
MTFLHYEKIDKKFYISADKNDLPPYDLSLISSNPSLKIIRTETESTTIPPERTRTNNKNDLINEAVIEVKYSLDVRPLPSTLSHPSTLNYFLLKNTTLDDHNKDAYNQPSYLGHFDSTLMHPAYFCTDFIRHKNEKNSTSAALGAYLALFVC